MRFCPDAIRSITLWPAQILNVADRVGSIAIGKDADIAVWDHNPYTMSTEGLKDLKCVLTLVGGRIVYGTP